MADNKSLESKFTWGDSVVVVSSSPKDYNPTKVGSICGVRLFNNLQTNEQYFLYLVEFSDGQSLEIPEKLLRLL